MMRMRWSPDDQQSGCPEEETTHRHPVPANEKEPSLHRSRYRHHTASDRNATVAVAAVSSSSSLINQIKLRCTSNAVVEVGAPAPAPALVEAVAPEEPVMEIWTPRRISLTRRRAVLRASSSLQWSRPSHCRPTSPTASCRLRHSMPNAVSNGIGRFTHWLAWGCS
jgi:hypothetical protein